MDTTKVKLGERSKDDIHLVMSTLKAGIQYAPLLDQFERDFIVEISIRYAKFWSNLCVTDAQMKTFRQIANKLAL